MPDHPGGVLVTQPQPAAAVAPDPGGTSPARERCAFQESSVPSSEVVTAATGPQTSSPPCPSPAQTGSAYAELSSQIREAGLLQRRPRYYAREIGPDRQH